MSRLWNLIEEESRNAKGQIIAAAAVSGAANAAVLAIVNDAVKTQGEPSLWLLGMLLAAVALFAFSLRLCVGMMSSLLEGALRKLRIRIADKIQTTELLGLESIGTSELFDRLTHQTSEISNATWPIASGVQSLVLLICSVFYLAYVSLTALLLTLGIYGAVAVIHYSKSRVAEQLMQQTGESRIRLLDVLSDLLRGFKEVRFRTERAQDLQADFRVHAEELEQGTVRGNLLRQDNFVLASISQFAVLAAVVFVLPQFTALDRQELPKITSALLFMFAPIGGALYGLPAYQKASLAYQNILELERRLDAGAMQAQSPTPGRMQEPFEELRLAELEFERKDHTGQVVFAVGPVSFSVRAGEVVFLVGGNGSGKTTLMRTLAALYPPTAGALLVNGVPVTPRNVQAYRELIAAIFTDFHLFKKLYGIPAEQAEKVQDLLEQMEIAEKTSLFEGTWSTVDLSTGQRKRVAMVVALLEDRPIYIFDEWAADQDPEFRRYFYEGLLPELKRKGKAVIAISHDDRYFHCADRVITLEYGKVRSIEQYAGVVSAPQPSDNPKKILQDA